MITTDFGVNLKVDTYLQKFQLNSNHSVHLSINILLWVCIQQAGITQQTLLERRPFA